MDYFNEKERASQEKFRVARDAFFSGIVCFLQRYNITPNMVSYLGVLFLLAILFVPSKLFWLSGIFLAMYVLMDGIDGPLARVAGKTHRGGAIVDMFADQIGVVIIPVAAIFYLHVDGIVSLLFSTSYLLLIVIVIFENELVSYRQHSFVRIKYIVYVAYVISLYFENAIVMYWLFLLGGVYYWFGVIMRINSIYTYFDNNK